MKGPLLVLILGLFILICTIKKPNFFWESLKVKFTRRILGDKITTYLYFGLSGFLIFACFYGLFFL